MATLDAFLSLLGQFPRRAPCTPRLLSEDTFDTHTRTLLEYPAEDGDWAQAYFLVPKAASGQHPGILPIHQDGEHRPYEYGGAEPAGQAGDPELHYGLELCLRGYAVICPDRFPFGSRSLSRSRYREAFKQLPLFTRYLGREVDLTEDLYRGWVANRLLWEGRTLLGKELFELQQALDCLYALPAVDARRIGVIGHSAGGLLATLLMYIDSRISVGCASCGTFLVEWIYGPDNPRPINGFGNPMVVPSLREWGDIDDILAGLAPRPFLETHADLTQELADRKSRKAHQRYAELGVPDRYKCLVYEAKAHVFRRDMREQAYAWFDHWLKPGTSHSNNHGA